MSGGRTQSTSSISKSAQIEVYKAIAERKEVGVGALKGWDQNSRLNLQQMRSLIDQMYEKLNFLLAESYGRQEKLIKFFSSIKFSTQNEFSMKDSLPKFTFGPTKIDPKTKARVPLDAAQAAFGAYIESVERELAAFQTALSQFHKQVEVGIVNKILVERNRPLEAKLKELFAEKKDVKERVKKLTTATKTSYDELFRQLYLSLGESNRVRRPTVNLFLHVFAFVNNVRKLSLTVREYGIYFVDIFKVAKDLEKERLGGERDAFFEFNAVMERTFSGSSLQGLKNSELALRKVSPAIWGADHFGLGEVVTPQQEDLIRKKVAASELTLETMKDYIAKEKIEENIKELFDHFVMRRFLVREADPKAAAQNDVIVYLTVDYFYTILQFNKTTKKHTCLADVPIEVVKLAFKDSATAVFCFEEAGFLWNSKKKISLVFQGNEREELKTDHENFVGLLTIGKRTADELAPVVGGKGPTQPPLPPKQEDPFAKPDSHQVADSQDIDRQKEIDETENRALAYSQARLPELKGKEGEGYSADPNTPQDQTEANEEGGFGGGAQLEQWHTD